MKLIVLASGKGSRLQNLTANNPKCLININGKPIISYSEKIFNKFDSTYFIAGHKSEKVVSYFKKNINCKVILNEQFEQTNMVYSMFVPRKSINCDVIVMYSDIIFDLKIIKKLLLKKKSIIPVKSNWFDYWKLRMNKKKILNDAEDLLINNGFLMSIGNKLKKKKLPKYQFMGLIRLTLKDYKSLYTVYKKLNNPKIDFTSLLNYFVSKYNGKIKCFKTKAFWLEIDSKKDILVAEKLI